MDMTSGLVMVGVGAAPLVAQYGTGTRMARDAALSVALLSGLLYLATDSELAGAVALGAGAGGLILLAQGDRPPGT